VPADVISPGLGARRPGAAFDADLTATFGPYGDGGTFTETVEFAYKLAGKPASLSIADGAFAAGRIQAQ